jgi:hypothetical protein
MVLYAPILASWMEDHPDAHVIMADIGSNDPSTFAECMDGQAYGDTEFEQAASECLRSLSGQASVIQADCPVLRDVSSPFDVTAIRQRDQIRVTVSATDVFEAATVSRSALKRPGKDVFFAETCRFEIKAFVRDLDLMPGFMDASVEGMSEMLDFAIGNGIVANIPAGHEVVLRKWAAAFPIPTRVSVKNLDGLRDVLVVSVGSAKNGMYLLAEEGDAYECVSAGVAATPEIPVYPYAPVAKVHRLTP